MSSLILSSFVYVFCLTRSLGKQLRKVERTEVDKRPIQYGSDVASILARRIAVEVSDSESGSDYSDSGSDWSD